MPRWQLGLEIDESVLELGISAEEFVKRDNVGASIIVNRVKEIYVENNPPVWWFALKHIVTRKHYQDGGYQHITEFIPRSVQGCWFIPEIHEDYPLGYETKTEHLENIIGNCIGFAYYIVDKNYNWLLAEDDADQLIMCVQPGTIGTTLPHEDEFARESIAPQKIIYRVLESRIQDIQRSGATELDLSFMSLTELPEALRRLTEIQSLNLCGNHLTALPEWLGQFNKLQHLDLSGNELTATSEPSKAIRKTLRVLNLSDTPVINLPKSLGLLTQVQTLNLSSNRLEVLPEWLGQLTQLRVLSISANRLTALPESLGLLTELQTLNLSFNRLTTLPETLRELTHLQNLDLSHNRLTALPESLGNLTELQKLNLFANRLTTLPESLRQLNHLRELYLSDNQLIVLPEWLGQLVAPQNTGLLIYPRNSRPVE